MPSLPRSEVDWGNARKAWESGILPRAEIARKCGIARQSLTERAEKEGWQYGVANLPTEPENPQTSLPSLKECRALVEEYSQRAERYRTASIDEQRRIVITPDRLANAVFAAHLGAKGKALANAAGVEDNALRNVLKDDKGMEGLIRAAHATHTLKSLRHLDEAQERGDSASARWLLEKGPYSDVYGSQSAAGSGGVQVTINIANPSQAQPDAILEISPVKVDIEQP